MAYRIAKVIPKKGVKVPRPASNRFLPETGAEVPLNPYWVRRLKEGDIELDKKAKAPTKKKKVINNNSDDKVGGQS